MRTSDNGRSLIKSFEGLRLDAYTCPAGVLTVGYGSTGPHVKPGMRITEDEADALLSKDLERFETGVESLVTADIGQDEFDALVSFSFNVGLGNLGQSTLLKLLNRHDYMGAAAQFGKWIYAGKKVLPGLVRRRHAEAALFRGDDWRTA